MTLPPPIVALLKANTEALEAGRSFVVVDSATWKTMWKKSLELYKKSVERYSQDTRG